MPGLTCNVFICFNASMIYRSASGFCLLSRPPLSSLSEVIDTSSASAIKLTWSSSAHHPATPLWTSVLLSCDLHSASDHPILKSATTSPYLPATCFPIRLQQHPWTNMTFSISAGICMKDPFALISPDVCSKGPSAKTGSKCPLQRAVYGSRVWKEVDRGGANLPSDISKHRLSQTTELCSVKLLSGVL